MSPEVFQAVYYKEHGITNEKGEEGVRKGERARGGSYRGTITASYIVEKKPCPGLTLDSETYLALSMESGERTIFGCRASVCVGVTLNWLNNKLYKSELVRWQIRANAFLPRLFHFATWVDLVPTNVFY